MLVFYLGNNHMQTFFKSSRKISIQIVIFSHSIYLCFYLFEFENITNLIFSALNFNKYCQHVKNVAEF